MAFFMWMLVNQCSNWLLLFIMQHNQSFLWDQVQPNLDNIKWRHFEIASSFKPMMSQFQMQKKLGLMWTNKFYISKSHCKTYWAERILLSNINMYTQLRVGWNYKLGLDCTKQYLLQVPFLKLSLPRHVYLIEKYANAHSNSGLIPWQHYLL